MSNYVIINEESKTINKFVRKYSEREVSNDKLRGSFKITRYRKYSYSTEVDVEFTGQLFARSSRLDAHNWHSSSIYNERGFSKVKINKFIKLYLFNEIRNQSKFFGINLTNHLNIKKITWV